MIKRLKSAERNNSRWSVLFLAFITCSARAAEPAQKPNVLYLVADQWRAAATGYAGDPNVKTPNLDRLAIQSVNFTHAVSGCPVCSPHRASLMTGQFPLTNGVFLNDVHLRDDATCLAEVFQAAGYDTGFIGKWHLNGRGRSNYIPPESRQGFDYWKVLDCTHDYNHSFYYAGNDPTRLTWPGYDADAQTQDAIQYLKDHTQGGKPFLLFVSWGPPHNPYQTAPQKYRAMYESDKIELRPNVPEKLKKKAQQDLAGYYAHCTALDDCVGQLLKTLDETGLARNTMVVFSSDHGAMLGSQGQERKQRPWDESIRVPLLIRGPRALGDMGRRLDTPINTPDLMPTLLSLAGLKCPDTVEGLDYSSYFRAGENPPKDFALISCPAPFGEWSRSNGGREFRGVRTERYTYVRDLSGPWLLYDNQIDPYQQHDLVNQPAAADVQKKLDHVLSSALQDHHDEFLPADKYIARWGYKVDAKGTVPYTP
ncbi:MAG TPA: sulfatase [Lacipirellulaceae bacterium]|jgi:arylsulfatase A-like enzyme|nr:sulfatase [Lacipirellulaceae bacterium]